MIVVTSAVNAINQRRKRGLVKRETISMLICSPVRLAKLAPNKPIQITTYCNNCSIQDKLMRLLWRNVAITISPNIKLVIQRMIRKVSQNAILLSKVRQASQNFFK